MNQLTSRETLEIYLEAWKRRNWQGMYDNCQITVREHIGKIDSKKFGGSWIGKLWDVNQFKKVYGKNKLEKWRVLENVTSGGNPVCHDYKIEAYLEIENRTYRRETTVRLLCEPNPKHTSTEGTWGVNPISVLGLYAPKGVNNE